MPTIPMFTIEIHHTFLGMKNKGWISALLLAFSHLNENFEEEEEDEPRSW